MAFIPAVFRRRRRSIASYIPVATYFEWVTSPSSSPLDAIGATRTILAKVTDQRHVPMATGQPTVTYSSGTPANVSISGSTITAVANGTSVITAHAATGGWTDLTGTATVQQAAYTLVPSPSSLSVSIGSDSSAITAGVFDRLGSPISGAPLSFVSSNTGLATVGASTGIVHGVAAGSPVITVSSTVGGGTATGTVSVTVSAAGADTLNPTTGAGVMGAVSTAVPMKWDAARVYGGADPDRTWRDTKFQNVDDSVFTEWLATGDNSKNGGVIGSSADYHAGSASAVDLVTLVPASIVVGGIPAFRFEWLPNVGSSPTSFQGTVTLPTNTRRLWIGRRIAHLLKDQIPGAWNWDTTGADATDPADITYNTSGGGAGPGFKHGPYGGKASPPTTTRAGIAGFVNASLDGNGKVHGEFQLDNDWGEDSTWGHVGFVDKSATSSDSLQTAYNDDPFNDGLTYDEVVLMELRADGNSNDWAITRYWRRRVNSDGTVEAWHRVGAYVTGSMQDGTGTWHNGWYYNTAQFTSKNHNRAIGHPRYRDISEWGAYDATNPNADGSDDPWGCLAADASTTPLPLVSAAFVSSDTVSGAFTLTRGSSSGVATRAVKIRAVIDGVDSVSANDYVIPFTFGDLDAFPVTVPLASGTHTVAFKTVSGDGNHVSTAYPTTPISVSTSDIPGTPTAANATSATSSSLTFPVTLASAGALPDRLGIRYSTDGGSTWTARPDQTLTSPSLGQVVNVTVGLPTASQAYTVQFQEKLSASAGSWSAPASGTTAAPGVSIPAGLSGVGAWGEDFSSYADDTALKASATLGFQQTTNGDYGALDTVDHYNGHNTYKQTTQTDGFNTGIYEKAPTANVEQAVYRVTLKMSAGGYTAVQALLPSLEFKDSVVWDTALSGASIYVDTDGKYYLSEDYYGGSGGRGHLVAAAKVTLLGTAGAELTSGYTVDWFVRRIKTDATHVLTEVFFGKNVGGATTLMKMYSGSVALNSARSNFYQGSCHPAGSGQETAPTSARSCLVCQMEMVDEAAHPDPFGLSAVTTPYTPLP